MFIGLKLGVYLHGGRARGNTTQFRILLPEIRFQCLGRSHKTQDRYISFCKRSPGVFFN